jgi:hypothetical protein
VADLRKIKICMIVCAERAVENAGFPSLKAAPVRGISHRANLQSGPVRTLPPFISPRQSALFFFIPLDTGPSRPLSLELSNTKVYEPKIRARQGTPRPIQATLPGTSYAALEG